MKLAEALAQRRVLVLDGGLATQLQARGHDLHDALWSAKILIEQPEAIEAVHRDYIAAGADVLTTATYQATFPGLARRGLPRARAEDVLRRAAALARKAGPDAVIAGSLGSYGAFLANGAEYRGDYALSPEALASFHRDRLHCMAGLVDVVAYETLPQRTEAKVLADLLAEHGDVEAWLSFSCPDGQHLADGTSLSDLLREIEGVPQIVAIGINCTRPQFISPLLTEAGRATRKPLIVYPNAEGRSDPETLAALAPAWVEAGARILGGCCGTTPEQIAVLARWRDRAFG